MPLGNLIPRGLSINILNIREVSKIICAQYKLETSLKKGVSLFETSKIVKNMLPESEHANLSGFL